MASPKVYREDAFAYRVNYAAQCFMKQRESRAFDTCFEMYDGAAVVTALVRRASKNTKLHAAIARQWSEGFPRDWIATASKYEHLPTRKLGELAKDLREESKRKFAEVLAAQSTTERNSTGCDARPVQ